VALTNPSPNFDSRGDQQVDTLVLHYTDMLTTEAAVAQLQNPESKVSAHYVVSEKGEIFSLVEEADRAWHAGESHWRGHNNINARSIGIEIANRGHSHGYTAFPPAQMAAVTILCHEILNRHDIPARNVVGHSDIAFLRKQDPGHLFDWQHLAREQIGIFPFDARPMMGSALGRGDSGTKVTRLQTSLSNWGYGLRLDGDYGEKTEKCVTAFQRHYRPGNIDGQWDDECAGLLATLHSMV